MEKRLTAALFVAAVVVLTGLSGCSVLEGSNADGGAVTPPIPAVATAPGEIVIKNLAFNPERIEVATGAEVVWRFDDGGLTHTVTATDGAFDSGRLTSGEFRHTFATAGEFAYRCGVHARMKGTVVVAP